MVVTNATQLSPPYLVRMYACSRSRVPGQHMFCCILAHASPFVCALCSVPCRLTMYGSIVTEAYPCFAAKDLKGHMEAR